MKQDNGKNQGPASSGSPKPTPGWENNENQDNTGPAPYTRDKRPVLDMTFDFLLREMITESKDQWLKEFKELVFCAFCEVHKLWYQTITTAVQANADPILLSPQDAAKMLGVTTRTLDRYNLTTVLLPSGHKRYLRAEIVDLINKAMEKAQKVVNIKQVEKQAEKLAETQEDVDTNKET